MSILPIILSNLWLIFFFLCNNTFLDTTSTLVDGKLDLNFHTKPPDSYLNLKSSSCYPPHTFRDITKGLAARVGGIYSTQVLKFHLCAILTIYFADSLKQNTTKTR